MNLFIIMPTNNLYYPLLSCQPIVIVIASSM